MREESYKVAQRPVKALKARGDNSRELIKWYINNHARMARIPPEAEAEREEDEEETSLSFIPAFSRERRKIADRRGSLNDTERSRNAEI